MNTMVTEIPNSGITTIKLGAAGWTISTCDGWLAQGVSTPIAE